MTISAASAGSERAGRSFEDHLVRLAFVAAILFAFAFLSLGWHTNDDVAMAMFAHGYGIAAEPTPNLYFSTVARGHLAQLLHGQTPFQGYTLVTALELAIAACAIHYSLRKGGTVRSVAAAAVVSAFALPVLLPQFTLNAGMLTVASVISARTFASTGRTRFLVIGVLVATIGFMARPLEFGLVALVGLPLLPWRSVLAARAPKVAAGILLAVIATVQIWDMASYGSSDWIAFGEANLARAPFTDYGAADVVRAAVPEVEEYGYSSNDLVLISRWFFADRDLLNAASLNRLLEASGYFGVVSQGAIDPARLSAAKGIFLHPLIAIFLLVGVAVALLRRRLMLLLATSVMALLVLAFATSGAPVGLRVFLPPAALIFVAALGSATRPQAQRMVSLRALPAIAGLIAALALWIAADHRQSANPDPIHAELRTVAPPLYIWGPAFPYETAFPVAYSPEREPLPTLYALGVLTYSPFGVGTFEEAAGRSLVGRLLEPGGILMAALPFQLDLLAVYCAERHGRTLDREERSEFTTFPVWQVSCR